MSEPDLDDLLELARRAAVAAGALLADSPAGDRRGVETKTSRTDMVSEMDRAAESLIVATLCDARPDDSILAEEGASRSGTSGVRWVIDPLDGTTNYLYGLPAFTVSIAAEVDGELAVGAVHDVARGETFTAARGRGARCNGERLHTSGADDLATALVATGFSYSAARRAWQGAVVSRVVGEVRDIRRVGAASLDLCWVAAGRLDAYWERTLQHWDFAAGAVIAAEAGAWVGGVDGGAVSGESVVAAAPLLAEPLLAVLRAAEAEAGDPPPLEGG